MFVPGKKLVDISLSISRWYDGEVREGFQRMQQSCGEKNIAQARRDNI